MLGSTQSNRLENSATTFVNHSIHFVIHDQLFKRHLRQLIGSIDFISDWTTWTWKLSIDSTLSTLSASRPCSTLPPPHLLLHRLLVIHPEGMKPITKQSTNAGAPDSSPSQLSSLPFIISSESRFLSIDFLRNCTAPQLLEYIMLPYRNRNRNIILKEIKFNSLLKKKNPENDS